MKKTELLRGVAGHAKRSVAIQAVAGPDHEHVLGCDNPFVSEDGRHVEWEAARSKAAERSAQLFASLASSGCEDWASVVAFHVEWWAGVFDIRAEVALAFLTTAQRFRGWLTEEADGIVEHVRDLNLPVSDEVVPGLRARLVGRHAHYVAAAYRAEARPRTAPPVDETKQELIARRCQLLVDYKEAVGCSTDSAVYENKKAGIHKPDFYKWRSGKMPSTSSTARNFERFLAAKDPLAPNVH